MSRNLLLTLEEHNIPHFVIKSYIRAAFESEEYRSEYHIYHRAHVEIGKWNLKCPMYEGMKVKSLSQEELKWFLSNKHRYSEEVKGKNGKLRQEDGNIWVNKRVKFDFRKVKKKVIIVKQQACQA